MTPHRPPESERATAVHPPTNWCSSPARPPIAAEIAKAETTNDGDANGSILREPELPEHEAIPPVKPTPAREEFTALNDEPNDEAQRAKQLRDRFCGTERQVSLDPYDGIEL